ncbi:hypothetical protein AM499_11245 [Bacillus sp. FJAT-22090]|uniref:DUF2920 family protein n=1 Tax=Bacillus sp. FJAT-22090 TaxID=1581038 RepID=UPI0006AEE618|nr:DUF2920 family protein [Bacillus sp. FJAT-22090]ALC86340.1 hypothetical protein AM499_11245 [Bacillus sp. FJAT-22090]
MSENLSINIPAHHNIYNGLTDRELRIDFSLPTDELNEETGLAILVPGFGGNIDSSVYKKMRESFSDEYNLVVMQCNYFGDDFMQSGSSFNIKGDVNELLTLFSPKEKKIVNNNSSKLLEVLSTKQITLHVVANLDEASDYFNDMGFMQAIDIITALEAVKIILKENNLKFDEKRIIGYGHSHGAYLIHLSNRLAPHMFSYIIDNSAWIEPVYLHSNRYLLQGYGQMTLQIEFDYLAKELIEDKMAFNLFTIYKNFNNSAKIISFQGNNDNLIDHLEKENLINSIPYAEFILIDENRVDQEIFKSNTHGLEADFLKMFEHSLGKFDYHQNCNDHFLNNEIILSNTKIDVDYSYGLPVFNIKQK